MTRRVLYIITDSGVGGAEKALLTLINGLNRSAYTPAGVIIVKGRREMAALWEAAGVPVTAIGMGRFPTLTGLLRLFSAIRSARPDIVHAFMFHSIQYARLARLFGSWRLVTSPRVSYRFFAPVARRIDSLMRAESELTVCESEAGRTELISRGYPSERVRVAPNGVDAGRYRRDDAARARLRRDWNVGEGEIVFGAVGRLHEQKGYATLLRATARLNDLKIRHRVLIAGEGPEKSNIETGIRELQVPVTLLGRRDDIPQFLSAIDVYVQSSRYEGMSNALLEALAAGLPSVATAVDGTLDFARDGENLLLVKPDDVDSLAIGMGYLLEKAGLRERLSQNAIITAQQQSVDRMVRSFEDAYDNACSIS